MELIRLQIPQSSQSYVDINCCLSKSHNNLYKERSKRIFDEDVHGTLVSQRSLHPFKYKYSYSDEKKNGHVLPFEDSRVDKPEYSAKKSDLTSKKNTGFYNELEVIGKSMAWNKERLEFAKFHNLKGFTKYPNFGQSFSKISFSDESVRRLPLTINEYLRNEDVRYYANEFAIKKFLFQRWLENLQRCGGKFYPIPLL